MLLQREEDFTFKESGVQSLKRTRSPKMSHIMIAKVREGEFLGDDEMFDKNSSHFFTAVCLSKCKTVSISKAALIGHFNNFPYLRKIMQ